MMVIMMVTATTATLAITTILKHCLIKELPIVVFYLINKMRCFSFDSFHKRLIFDTKFSFLLLAHHSGIISFTTIIGLLENKPFCPYARQKIRDVLEKGKPIG